MAIQQIITDLSNDDWQKSAILSKTGAYELTASDKGKMLLCNGTFAITMPTMVAGVVYSIKNIGSGTITITPAGSDTSDVTSLAAGESVILIGDTTNTKWRSLAKETASAGASVTELSFVNGDLTTGVLTVTHNKSLAAGYTALVAVVNNSGAIIIPDQINTFATNSFKVDLTSYGTLTGTWYVIYITK